MYIYDAANRNTPKARLFGCEKTLSCPGVGSVCRHNIYDVHKHRTFICDCLVQSAKACVG